MSGRSVSAIVRFGGLGALLVFLLWLSADGWYPFLVSTVMGGKLLTLPSETGKGIDVQLRYDTGSHGVPTFLVTARNVSGHTLALVSRVRYFTLDEQARGESGFLICLLKPWGRVPLNTYSTGLNTAVDSLAGPFKAGEETTMEYDMVRGDVGRIGSYNVQACVVYYDADPTQSWTEKQPTPLAAWSNAIKVEPLQWGLDDYGIQVGLQISLGTVTVKVRNNNPYSVTIRCGDAKETSDGKSFSRLIVQDYSGMYKDLHPTDRESEREIFCWLDPGASVSSTYHLTTEDLWKLQGKLLKARVIFDNPARPKGGPSAFSNDVVAGLW